MTAAVDPANLHFQSITFRGQQPGPKLIVSGAVAYHNLIGAFDARPTWLSKTTTLFQILLVLAELLRLSWVPQLSGLDALLVFTAVLTVASGVHYVLVWSMRARRAWAARRHLQQGE